MERQQSAAITPHHQRQRQHHSGPHHRFGGDGVSSPARTQTAASSRTFTTNVAGTSGLGSTGEASRSPAVRAFVSGNTGRAASSPTLANSGVYVRGRQRPGQLHQHQQGRRLPPSHFFQFYGINLSRHHTLIAGNVISATAMASTTNQGEFSHIEGNLIGTDPPACGRRQRTAGVTLSQAPNNVVGAPQRRHASSP